MTGCLQVCKNWRSDPPTNYLVKWPAVIQIHKASSLLLVTIAAALAGGGCRGRSYHLPGHTFSNRADPPNLTMRVGEHRKAITTGFTLGAMGPAFMESSDPAVITVEPTDATWNAVYLRGRGPGVATLHYELPRDEGSPANDGFEVRVLPAK